MNYVDVLYHLLSLTFVFTHVLIGYSNCCYVISIHTFLMISPLHSFSFKLISQKPSDDCFKKYIFSIQDMLIESLNVSDLGYIGT